MFVMLDSMGFGDKEMCLDGSFIFLSIVVLFLVDELRGYVNF